MRRREGKLIPAPGSPQFLHVFGAYNWHTGHISYLTTPQKTAILSSLFSNTCWQFMPANI
jgi:hypothetical protein